MEATELRQHRLQTTCTQGMLVPHRLRGARESTAIFVYCTNGSILNWFALESHEREKGKAGQVPDTKPRAGERQSPAGPFASYTTHSSLGGVCFWLVFQSHTEKKGQKRHLLLPQGPLHPNRSPKVTATLPWGWLQALADFTQGCSAALTSRVGGGRGLEGWGFLPPEKCSSFPSRISKEQTTSWGQSRKLFICTITRGSRQGCLRGPGALSSSEAHTGR